jgi:hypothetical protein
VSREAEILLAKLDEFAVELARFRAEVAALIPPAECAGSEGADDLAPEHLLDTHAASARFGYPRDTRCKPTYGNAHRRGQGRTWRPVHRSSSPIARWLLFVVKGFSNFGSRRMRSTSRHARAPSHILCDKLLPQVHQKLSKVWA